jgi:hypothetical protein
MEQRWRSIGVILRTLRTRARRGACSESVTPEPGWLHSSCANTLKSITRPFLICPHYKSKGVLRLRLISTSNHNPGLPLGTMSSLAGRGEKYEYSRQLGSSGESGLRLLFQGSMPAHLLPLRTWLPSERVSCLICAGLAAALAVAGLAGATQFWRVLPFQDQWEMVRFYQSWSQGTATIWDLAVAHNEHRILLTRLVFLADFTQFHGSLAFAYAALVVLQLGLAFAVGLAIAQGRHAAERAAIIAVAAAFLVSPVQLANLVQPFQSAIASVCLFAMVASYAVARMADRSPTNKRPTFLVIAVVAMLLSAYSMANGLAAAILATMLAILLPLRRRDKIAMVVACGLIVAVYLWGFSAPDGGKEYRANLNTFQGVTAFIGFALAILGSVAVRFGVTVSIVVGAAGVLIWTVLGAYFIASRPRGGEQRDPNTTTLLALATFAIATAAMVAFGRTNMGIEQALSMRFGTFSIVFWVALAGVAWRLDGTLAPTARWWKPATASASVALLIMSYSAWTTLSPEIASHAALIDVVTEELRRGRFQPDHVSSVYPFPDAIRPATDFLRTNRLSIFAN